MDDFQTINLGQMSYQDAWKLQLEMVEKRQRDEIADTFLVVEHFPVITLGRKMQKEGMAIPAEIGGVPLFAVERGGETTFHGPGQLVVYPILKLRGIAGPKWLLRKLEEAIVTTLHDLGVNSFWIEGKTGVWLNHQGQERKIASLGISIRYGVSFHGLALNVSTNLNYFNLIQPCGFAPSVMTNLEEITGRKFTVGDVAPWLEKNLQKSLRYPCDSPSLSLQAN